MDPVKNRGRTNLFACFKPVADGDEPCVHPPPPSSVGESGGRTKSAHQMFYGSLKAVFLRTPLVKKLRNKRHSRRDSCRSSNNLQSLTKTKKLITAIKRKPSQKGFSDQEDNSDHNSSLFSSTCSNSCASSISSRSGSERLEGSGPSLDLKQNITKNRGHGTKRAGSKCNYNPAAGMCIILVCLVALVFGGKAFAIVTCISTWLVFAPSRLPEGGGATVKNGVVESEEDRKRVIIEGLLERNRPRVGF